jgi:hypothetical protein
VDSITVLQRQDWLRGKLLYKRGRKIRGKRGRTRGELEQNPEKKTQKTGKGRARIETEEKYKRQ